jgi:protease-4
MRRDLLMFRQVTGKPVIASILDVGAGGAYYIATACDRIFAHPTSVVGGVGVVINLYDLKETMSQQNIEPQTVRSGDHVDLGTPIKPLSEEGKEILEEIAEEFHVRFQEAVQESRKGVEEEDLDGRVFTGGQAKDAGLVDDVIYFDEAIARIKSTCGVGDNAKVVMFRRNNDRALTEFDITPNTPTSLASIPISIPGLDRAALPHFLYLWQPEPGLEMRGY